LPDMLHAPTLLIFAADQGRVAEAIGKTGTVERDRRRDAGIRAL